MIFVSVPFCTIFHLEFEYLRCDISRNLTLGVVVVVVVVQEEDKFIKMKLEKIYCCSRVVIMVLQPVMLF
jgi:hypothetical protein